MEAVSGARVAFLLAQLERQESRAFEMHYVSHDTFAGACEAIIPRPASYDSFGQDVVMAYHDLHDQQGFVYAAKNTRRYATSRLDAFYVHVPSWASITSVSEQGMGRGVLGTANVLTGEIRLLESLDSAGRTEVLLHETLHLLYPLHPEKEIRNLTRTIMGAQYCQFH